MVEPKVGLWELHSVEMKVVVKELMMVDRLVLVMVGL